MNFPSVKTLMSIPGVDIAKAKRIRAIMRGLGQSKMTRIDSELGTYGVEYIPAGHNAKSPAIEYCNTGDTYRVTVLRVRGRFVVGCWGDIVERGKYD